MCQRFDVMDEIFLGEKLNRALEQTVIPFYEAMNNVQRSSLLIHS